MECFGNFTTRINIAQIAVKQHFNHHSGSKSGGATTFIFGSDVGDVQLIDHITYQVNWMIFRNSLKDIDRK